MVLSAKYRFETGRDGSPGIGFRRKSMPWVDSVLLMQNDSKKQKPTLGSETALVGDVRALCFH